MEKYLGGGGAFSSKLIQLCLNTIYNSEFRYNWVGGGGGGGVQKPFGEVLNTSGGGGGKNFWGCG